VAQIRHVAVALPAFGFDAVEDGLILRRERSLLVTGETARTADRAPLPAEVWIFRIVPGPSRRQHAAHGNPERARERDGANRSSVKHRHPPSCLGRWALAVWPLWSACTSAIATPHCTQRKRLGVVAILQRTGFRPRPTKARTNRIEVIELEIPAGLGRRCEPR